MTMKIEAIKTLGELKAKGYEPKTIKEELRANLLAKIKEGALLFEGIVGYDDTVIPQLINAILSQHNINLLGLRGQAKTRIARSLTDLLDDYIPIVKGSEVNDDPFAPISLILSFPSSVILSIVHGGSQTISILTLFTPGTFLAKRVASATKVSCNGQPWVVIVILMSTSLFSLTSIP